MYKPIKLHLRGFSGIKSGLNRDEIELDLASLAGDAALVALVGPNGVGKTTLLDNLIPYRFMPSRATAYSPKAFSYFDHICAPEAYKSLVWQYDNTVYQTEIVLRAGKSSKQEAYLNYRDSCGKWVPVSLPDGTVSDGRTTTYDTLVNHILGDPEFLCTSSFSAQGRRPLVDYGASEIKALLSELLGLEQLRVQSDGAARVARLLSGRLEDLRPRLQAAVELESDLQAARSQYDAEQAQRTRLSENIAKLKHQYIDLQAETDRLAAEYQQQSGNEARRAELATRITSAKTSIASLLAQMRADRAAEQHRHESDTRAAESDLAAMNQQYGALERLINSHAEVLAQRIAILNACEALPSFMAARQRAEEAVHAARARVTSYQAAEHEKQRLLDTKSVLKRERAGLVSQQAKLRQRACLVNTVPCNKTDLAPRCPLLQDAHHAHADSALMDGRIATLDAELAALDARYDAAVKASSVFENASADLALEETNLREINAAIDEAQRLSGLKAILLQAEESKHTAETQIAQLRERLDGKRMELAHATEQHRARLALLDARMDDAARSADQDIRALEESLQALPSSAYIQKALNQAQQRLADNKQAQVASENLLRDCDVRMAVLKERLAQLSSHLSQAQGALAMAARLETEIAQWTLLAKALGNDGIVALTIDEAGPLLSTLANDLLLSCYGPRFSVAFRTQAVTGKGNLKEVFDIVVYDAEHGGEKKLDHMCGGEKVWINECLTRALALHQARTSGRRYATLFADESDGALDPERKRMFMAMKRAVLELGGYEREYFISHTPELQEMADAIIDVAALAA